MSASAILTSLLPQAALPPPAASSKFPGDPGRASAFDGMLDEVEHVAATPASGTPEAAAATPTQPGSLLTLAERIAAAPAAGLDVDGAVTRGARLGAAAKPTAAPSRVPQAALRAQAPLFARPFATTSAPPTPATQTKVTSDTPKSAGKGPIAKAGFEAADATESPGPSVMAAVSPAVASLPSGLDLTNAAQTLRQAVSAQTAAAKAPLGTAPAAPEAGPISTGLRALAAKSSAAKAAAEDSQQNAASAEARFPPNVAPSDLFAAVASIADAIAVVDPGGAAPAAATAAALATLPTTSLAVSGVQKRTHLTVTGSRLFELTSSRALDALEAAPKVSVGAGPAIKAPAAATARADSGAKPAADAPPSTAAASIESRAVVGDVVPVPAGVSVAVGDLADRLADEASSLAPSATSAPDATPARGPVKELQFQLEPADLGKVAVRLRMSTGRLTVDLGVASPGALVELEKQREAMAAKLNTAQQPLESLVIHQRSTPEAHDSSHSASTSGFTESSAESAGQSASRRDPHEPTERPSRPDPATSASSGALAQFSDLVV